MTSHALEAAGLSRDTAENLDMAFGTAGTMAGTVALPRIAAPSGLSEADIAAAKEAALPDELGAAGKSSSVGGPKPALGVGDIYKAHAAGEAGVLADLDADGMLNLYIKTGPGTPSGSQMFREALSAFGDKVKGVRGTWLNSKSIGDNFRSYKDALGRGLAPEQAVFETFTGKMAQRCGFGRPKIVEDSGARVIVEFTR